MKCTVQTVGPVDIEQRWFVAEGGEKKIFANGSMGYAIYLDPAKMIPVAKIKELSVLEHPNIIRPQLLILDKHNKPIGHTMRFIRDALPFTQLFPKTFKQQHQLTPDKMLKIVRDFQAMIQYIHSKKILVVDLNELNFLIDNIFQEVYAIDVNSYQTPSFPATVIMPNIRDRHATKFDEGTDWFSWGIVSFQLQIGMHPYKGGHPDFQMAPDERLEARMQKNVSVFHQDATMPGAALPLDIIPPALRAWYVSVFEHGKRCPPPLDYQGMAAVITKVKQIVGSNQFMIVELASFDDPIVAVYCSVNNRVVVTESAAYINNRKIAVPREVKIGFTPKMNRPVTLHMDKGTAYVTDMEKGEILYKLPADGVMASDGRLYIRSGMNILEIQFIEIGAKTIAAAKTIASVLDFPEATKMYNGVILQNMGGRYFASIFPESGICKQIGLPELDHCRLIEAKYENKVLVIVAEKRGKYDRFVMRFDDSHASYDTRKIEDIDYTGLNFTVADHGVCVMLNEGDEIEGFSNKKNAGSVKLINDPAIDGDVRFFHDGSQVLFTRGKKLFSMTMRVK